MPIADPTTARGTVHRGLRASSPSGADDSKPMNARTANTMPLKIPLYVPVAAWLGLNVCSVKRPVFERIIQSESATKTVISKMPRITPASVERRMSR